MPVSPEELKIGTKAIPFRLKGVDDKYYLLDDFSDKQVLCIIFSCNHCPYVKAVEDRINGIAKDYASKSFGLVCINPNDDEGYPEDSFEEMKNRAKEKGFVFPYLRDESQQTARAYDAVCTPDIYLYDADRILKYRGRIDDSWKDESKVTRKDLRMAIDCLLEGKEIDFDTVHSLGCSIKWAPSLSVAKSPINLRDNLSMRTGYYYVYIMTNKYNKVLYTGVTNDLSKRIYEHKNKLLGYFTKKYNVNKLVYFEQIDDVSDAIAREKQIKGWLRKKKIDLINSKNPEWKDLS